MNKTEIIAIIQTLNATLSVAQNHGLKELADTTQAKLIQYLELL